MTRPSLWQDRHPAPPTVPETLQGSADVVVVGAGITGLTTALLLARAGKQVHVLEGREPGAGATGRSTAKVTALQGTRLSEITSKHGTEVAAGYVAANTEGQAWVREFCERHDVPHETRDAVTFDWPGESGAQGEHDAATAAGLPVEWHPDLPVPWPTGGGVVLRDQLQVDPMALVARLADEARAHGAVISSGQRVQKVSLRAPYVVETEHGTLRAEHVVVCTNLPVLDRGGFFARMKPQRSYAVVAQAPGHGVHGMYLSAQSPSRSVRDVGPDLVMVGGEGHVTGRAQPTSLRPARLAAWTDEVFPGATITHDWSAQDFEPTHGLPFAGPLLPGHDGLLMAGGYAKWGFTNGPAAALALSARLLGGHIEWASVLEPWRSRELRGTPSFLETNATVALHLGRGWLRPDKAVGQRRVCSHLGGVVAWNDAEESWDCPLHGSRFDRDGSVLEGPACRPLKP